MTRHLPLVAILTLALTGGAVALAQDGTTTQTIPGEVTELASITEITYGDTTYALSPEDGTVAVGFVLSRTMTTDGATLVVVLMGHDQTGWRTLGTLSGEAAGELAAAVPGDVVTLAIVGSGE